MATRGGYRPGSGAKQGQRRVHVQELREAIERHVGMPYQEVLALTLNKLFIDFQNDKNIKEYIVFTEHMNKRILQDQVAEISIANPLEELSSDEIKDRIKKLVLLEMNAKTVPESEETDAQDNNGDNDVEAV